MNTDLPSAVPLTATTASAIAVSERLFSGLISTEDYDAQALTTTIYSVTKLTYLPILMTMDDDPTAILTLAGPALGFGTPENEKNKVYLCCSTRTIGFVDFFAPISGDTVRLDQDALKRLYMYLKESDRTDQLLIAREDDIVGPDYLKMVLTDEEHREGDARTVEGLQPTASSSGNRPGPGPSSKDESSALGSIQKGKGKGKEKG